jgi:hypothetical protein
MSAFYHLGVAGMGLWGRYEIAAVGVRNILRGIDRFFLVCGQSSRGRLRGKRNFLAGPR